jgi:uncharacterized membrane protein YdjX (TVP38/TMEM64 family)
MYRRSSSGGPRGNDDVAAPSASSDGNNAPPAVGPGDLGNSGNDIVGGIGGGIDAFLQRLDDDVDLKKMKKKRRGEKKRHGHLGRDDDAVPSDGGGVSDPTSTSRLAKKIAAPFLLAIALFLAYDAATSPPEDRIVGARRVNDFLLWVRVHPGTGAAAFVLVYGACVVLLLPGTPLTLGGGYVYKVSYGWSGGLVAGTLASTAGSLLGSCSAFLLGRHVMRDRVRRWGRRHPLFDAMDAAVSENGFRIMCLLYLTPILPLGPVSYMCGTTSMPLAKFAAAKVAAVPLMLLYTFIGASTDEFFSAATDAAAAVAAAPSANGDGGGGAGGTEDAGGGGGGVVRKDGVGVDEETHRKMVLFGLVLSVVSMSLVSHFVKKELYKVRGRRCSTTAHFSPRLRGGVVRRDSFRCIVSSLC